MGLHSGVLRLADHSLHQSREHHGVRVGLETRGEVGGESPEAVDSCIAHARVRVLEAFQYSD